MIVIQEVVCQKSGSLIYSSLLGITIILAAEDDDDDNDDGDDDDHGDDDDDDDDNDNDDDDDIFESRWRRHIGKECSRIWAAAKFTFNVPLLFISVVIIAIIMVIISVIWGSEL